MTDSEIADLSDRARSLNLSTYDPDTVPYETATFALSWFWFPEAQFGSAEGVLRTKVGFTGGKKNAPNYYSL